MNNQRIAPAILAAALLVAACAAPPPKPVMRDNLIQKTATVEAVDAASRLVTLRLENGTSTTIKQRRG